MFKKKIKKRKKDADFPETMVFLPKAHKDNGKSWAGSGCVVEYKELK